MGIVLTTTHQGTASKRMSCKTCGREIKPGMSYWYKDGGLATAGLTSDGPWCGQNCIPKKNNESKGGSSGSNGGGGAAGRPKPQVMKIKHGMSTRAKSVIVYAVVGIFGLCLLGGLFAMCSEIRRDNKETKKIKKELTNMQSIEYQIPTVMLEGKLGDYIQISDVSVKTLEGEYSAILSFKVTCIKEFSEIEDFYDPSLDLNLGYSSGLSSNPSHKSMGAAIGNMKKNTELSLKTKISADSSNAEIQAYKEYVVSKCEIGTWSFGMDYWAAPDKGGHKQADERRL